ncbi:hypothetical protein GCM10008955_07520 [Deinococcus malanensis]|uniref:GGDEF domain-containing protein n=1 Tax=Deinococcus malanensis TaxID=1706855 RepID=A0ABQ2EPZ2_9DEIO|nr:hypothetical protein [Deinococcus malanensis]GGK16615.1 hypothetical protein GCM10008955_07520 [Deinococcus malanensis]
MSLTVEKSIKLRLLVLVALLGSCAFVAGSVLGWPLGLGLIVAAGAGVLLSPSWSLALGLVLAFVTAVAWQSGSLPVPEGASGTHWLWLIGAALLPRLGSEVAHQARGAQAMITQQAQLLTRQTELHPVTELPGPGLAQMFVGVLQAEYQRSGGQGAAMAVRITDLPVARQLYDPTEVATTLRRARDAVRGELRASDWMFQLTDELFLVIANVGHEPDGHLAMARRVAAKVNRVHRITMQTQVMLLPNDMAFPAMLDHLLGKTPFVPPADESVQTITTTPLPKV